MCSSSSGWRPRRLYVGGTQDIDNIVRLERPWSARTRFSVPARTPIVDIHMGFGMGSSTSSSGIEVCSVKVEAFMEYGFWRPRDWLHLMLFHNSRPRDLHTDSRVI